MTQVSTLQQPISGADSNWDRRGSSRFRISLPLTIRYHPARGDSKELSGETINISGRGFYLATDTPLQPGTRLSLTVALPDKKISPAPIVARARVRVVRSEGIWHQGVRKVGVAAAVEYYSV
jgi:c-di-GMP-binding flagellar brake protein YcgR